MEVRRRNLHDAEDIGLGAAVGYLGSLGMTEVREHQLALKLLATGPRGGLQLPAKAEAAGQRDRHVGTPVPAVPRDAEAALITAAGAPVADVQYGVHDDAEDDECFDHESLL